MSLASPWAICCGCCWVCIPKTDHLRWASSIFNPTSLEWSDPHRHSTPPSPSLTLQSEPSPIFLNVEDFIQVTPLEFGRCRYLKTVCTPTWTWPCRHEMIGPDVPAGCSRTGVDGQLFESQERESSEHGRGMRPQSWYGLGFGFPPSLS